ncbi:MAG: dihydroorotate dehydrogenase electron transfer subunit [Polyangiaceae bacterium]|nr:dihydroorotate dehydrogenase electron transfer subunit [Polyangiaceae bacterium]
MTPSHPPSAPSNQYRHLRVPLLRRESVGNAYHVLSFEVPDGLPADPGQFVMVRATTWGNSPLLPRPMSLLTGGTTPEILLKVVGEGTLRMGRAEPGELFSLTGPLGRGWRGPHPARQPLLVAGGVGIAPLLFLARELASSGRRPLAIYGGRTSRDLPFSDDLEEVAEVHITTEDGSRGLRGRVTDVLDDLLTPESEVFTCGPDRMMAAVADATFARDVPCQVSLEAPMACGFGVCLGCPVPAVSGGYLYACQEGPCLDARRIAWYPPTSQRGAR